MDLLCRGGLLCTQNDARDVLEADLLVKGGRIAAIGKGLVPERACRVLDARGRVVIRV